MLPSAGKAGTDAAALEADIGFDGAPTGLLRQVISKHGFPARESFAVLSSIDSELSKGMVGTLSVRGSIGPMHLWML